MVSTGIVPSLKEYYKLSDTEIKDRLTKIKGVGPWTVEMLLIFNFGRLDVLPIHDLGVRKGFQLAYKKRKLPTPEQLERFGRKWKPYRTIATLYLWGAADFINLNEW
jgi:3-methyladenine DNA glycosylase/8-oxoguanine DNA glycosylase